MYIYIFIGILALKKVASITFNKSTVPTEQFQKYLKIV